MEEITVQMWAGPESRAMLEADYKKIMAELQKAATDFMKERGYLE